MKPRTLLVLALMVAALGAFIWFVERDLPSTDERGERAKKVLPLAADGVTAVEIRVGGEVTRLEKSEPAQEADTDDAEESALDVPARSEWRLVAPLAARADADAVEELVDTLAELEKVRTLEDVEPAALGLAEPRATVKLSAGGEDFVLEVGEAVPASSNLIVGLAGGSDAFVVGDAFWSELEKPAGDWRSREAFAADRDSVVDIRLSGASKVRLRRVDGGFAVEEPYRDEASEEKVDELLVALTGLEIASFLDGPLDAAALGLEPPAAKLAVTLEGRTAPVEIAIGSPVADGDSTRHIELDGQRFTADTGLVELTGLEPGDWRSTAWSRLEVYEVDSVDLRHGQTATRLERAAGDWLRDGVKIAHTAASDLLYAVRDAAALGVAERGALSLPTEPLLEITVATAEREEILRLFPRTESGYPAGREGRDPLVMIAADSVDELLAKIEAVESAEPLPAPAQDAPPAD